MNERIKELYDQASIRYSVYEILKPREERKSIPDIFAELIVQECVKHITDQQDLVETNWQCKDGIHIVYSLKEHFGVEE